jgi:hypothetical protein
LDNPATLNYGYQLQQGGHMRILPKIALAALVLAAVSFAGVKLYRSRPAQAAVPGVPAYTIVQRYTLTHPGTGETFTHNVVRHVKPDLNFVELKYNREGALSVIQFSRDGRMFAHGVGKTWVNDYGALPNRLIYREDEVRGGVAMRDLPSKVIHGVKCYKIGGTQKAGEDDITTMWVAPSLQVVMELETTTPDGKPQTKVETVSLTYGGPDWAEVEKLLPPRSIEVRQTALSKQ